MSCCLPEDQFKRPLHDLRISVTDRCNFRCTYCMPRDVFGANYAFLPKSEILSFEEISRVTRIFIGEGVRKVRLTGGEPLLRKDLDRLISQLSAIGSLEDLTLTTNGSLLKTQAKRLRDAGLKRLTISLDALDDSTFQSMNDVDFSVQRVLDGIDASLEAGFSPIKINAVIRRGVNEHAIDDLAERFAGPEFVVRFIEYMDVGNTNGWRLDEVVSASEIAGRLGLEPLEAQYRGEVARRYRTARGGEIGLIASVSQPFCRDCTRIRLTADGKLFTCLFGHHGHDLRAQLRAGASDEQLAALIRAIWTSRTDRYSEIRGEASGPPKVEMSAIGG